MKPLFDTEKVLASLFLAGNDTTASVLRTPAQRIIMKEFVQRLPDILGGLAAERATYLSLEKAMALIWQYAHYEDYVGRLLLAGLPPPPYRREQIERCLEIQVEWLELHLESWDLLNDPEYHLELADSEEYDGGAHWFDGICMQEYQNGTLTIGRMLELAPERIVFNL